MLATNQKKIKDILEILAKAQKREYYYKDSNSENNIATLPGCNHDLVYTAAEKILSLMEKPEDLNIYNSEGETLLGFVCEYTTSKKDVVFVKELIEKGANVFVTDKQNRSAIHYAIWGGNIEIVKYILTFKPELNGKNAALNFAFKIPYIPYHRIVEELIHAGAKFNGEGITIWERLFYCGGDSEAHKILKLFIWNDLISIQDYGKLLDLKSEKIRYCSPEKDFTAEANTAIKKYPDIMTEDVPNFCFSENLLYVPTDPERDLGEDGKYSPERFIDNISVTYYKHRLSKI